jgi:hypothetical protein
MLHWVAKNRMGRRGLESSGSRHSKVAGCYAVVIEPSGSTQFSERLVQLKEPLAFQVRLHRSYVAPT